MDELLARLLSRGEAALHELVSSGYQEHVGLEFKTKTNSVHGNYEKEDKRNLGKELSAFANSMGGILIWGVEARKNTDGVDCAVALRPIRDIRKFESETKTLIGNHIAPRHEGIRVQAIMASEQPDSGYLVIDVERSERRPHRSEATGDKQYYKRAGDSSYPMEHFDIEDAFKRFVSPTLDLSGRIRPNGSATSGPMQAQHFHYILRLRNTSSVSAEAIYMQIQGAPVHDHEPGAWGIDGHFGRAHAAQFNGGVYCFQGGANDFLHPGQEQEILAIRLSISSNRGVLRFNQDPLLNSLRTVTVQYGCKNSVMKELPIRLSISALKAELQELSLETWSREALSVFPSIES